MHNTGLEIDSIYSRSLPNALELANKCSSNGVNQLDQISLNSDIYIICVPDDMIRPVVISLSNILSDDKLIAHTSGSRPISDLNSFQNVGAFYPLQTFTKGKELNLSNIPFLIHSNDTQFQDQLESLARTLSPHVYPYTDSERSEVHVSAVMANNFVNHILYLSENHLKNKGLDPKILHPLIKETIDKALTSDVYEAQTGPARRHDISTLVDHIERLSERSRSQKIYSTISKSILKAYPQNKKT